MSTFADRLKILQGDKSLRGFAKHLKTGVQTLSNYLNGRGVPLDFAVHVWRQTNCDFFWLTTGESPATFESCDKPYGNGRIKELPIDEGDFIKEWNRLSDEEKKLMLGVIKSMKGKVKND